MKRDKFGFLSCSQYANLSQLNFKIQNHLQKASEAADSNRQFIYRIHDPYTSNGYATKIFFPVKSKPLSGSNCQIFNLQ